jgi:hypothetical protein
MIRPVKKILTYYRKDKGGLPSGSARVIQLAFPGAGRMEYEGFKLAPRPARRGLQ